MQEAVRITVRCEVQKSLLNTAHCTPQHPQQPVSTGYSCKNATVTGNHHNALRDRSVGSENFMHTAGYDGVLQRGGGLWAWFTAQFYVCFPPPLALLLPHQPSQQSRDARSAVHQQRGQPWIICFGRLSRRLQGFSLPSPCVTYRSGRGLKSSNFTPT